MPKHSKYLFLTFLFTRPFEPCFWDPGSHTQGWLDSLSPRYPGWRLPRFPYRACSASLARRFVFPTLVLLPLSVSRAALFPTKKNRPLLKLFVTVSLFITVPDRTNRGVDCEYVDFARKTHLQPSPVEARPRRGVHSSEVNFCSCLFSLSHDQYFYHTAACCRSLGSSLPPCRSVCCTLTAYSAR